MKTAFAFIVACVAGFSTAAAQGTSSGGSSTRPETSVSNTSPAASYPPKKATPAKTQSKKTQNSTLEPENRTSPTGTMSESSRRVLKESRPASPGTTKPTGSTNQEMVDKNSKQPIKSGGKSGSTSGSTTN
ncbi:hypothetical protein [Hymenobacter radiodurans]|uniref:hypothetical protein n=1 Tax=Hymenobacter radiodurans TaxID=2496028 RepID=UPI001059052E|nr:hypothetical protein [Hymenobacter radiodurans]